MKTEFDEKAADWDENPDRVKRAESIADSIRTRINLQDVKKALEYGSGTGLLSFALQQDLKSVVLMDESIEMTKVALEKCQRFKVNHFKPMQYNLIEDPLPDEKFDLIYILLTLHHVKDYESLISKFSNLLNRGGHLAIIDLEKEDGSFHDGEFHGHKGFDKDVLKKKILESGLNNVSYEVCYEIEKVDEVGVKTSYPLFLLVARKE